MRIFQPRLFRILLWSILLLGTEVHAQGQVMLRIYESEIYDSHRQNWAISQNTAGEMIFGNQTGGIIRYDGVKWSTDHVPSGNTVRSLAQFNNRIHWGGTGDFGYILPDSSHRPTPVSLKHQIDSTRQSFSDVWQMTVHNEKLYHRTSDKLFVVDKEDNITVIPSEQDYYGIFTVNGQLIVNIEGRGLTYLEGREFADIPGSDIYKDDRVYSALPYSDTQTLFISRKNGFKLFNGKSFTTFETEADAYLSEHLVYRATAVSDSLFALATLSGGIILMNRDGTIAEILTEQDGLPTNIIYELYSDHEQTLWAATDNGLVSIPILNPVTKLDERAGFNGIPTFITEYQGNRYFGSTEGLFVQPNSDKKITKFEELTARSLSSAIIDNRLVLSASNGFFEISNGSVHKLSDDVFSHLKISTGAGTTELYASQEDLLYKLELTSHDVRPIPVIKAESEISGFSVHSNNIWIIYSSREVHRYRMNGTLIEKYSIPIQQDEELRQIDLLRNQLHVGSDGGLFYFDSDAGQFRKNTRFGDSELTSEQVFRFVSCDDNDVWFRNNRKIKRGILSGGKWTLKDGPYRMIGEGGSLEIIHCEPSGNGVWFGGTRGIYHLSDPGWEYRPDFPSNITAVLVKNDSLIYGGAGRLSDAPRLQFSDNDLRFTYAAASYLSPGQTEYRVRLRGYEDWSSWSHETQKDYTFIPEGHYTFEVESRNIFGIRGTPEQFSFSVLPPWHRTIWAYAGYLLAAGGLLFTIYRVRILRILHEQEIRNSIARDLHDELSSTLSSINFFADAIESQKVDEKGVSRFLSLITASSREAKEKISDIVWVIHTENDDWESLCLRCKRYASDLLDSRMVDHRFTINGTATGKPDLQVRKNIWLIFRETVTNIARHAGARHVEISFMFHHQTLEIVISDDGDGFDMEKTKRDGNGVINIQTRTEKIGGRSHLNTSPGHGTEWKFEIPL